MTKRQYPGLEIPNAATGETRVFLESVKEIVESMTGVDGGTSRMLTVDELVDLGVVKSVGTGSRRRLVYTPPDIDIPDVEQPKYARLVASSQFFTFASGTPAPAEQVITFNVIRGAGTEGQPLWTTYPDVDLGGAGDQVTLSVADFGANDSVRLRVELDGVFDELTVFRLEQSDSGVGCFLSNESHVVAADVTGAVANFDGANGLFKVFDGATDVSGSATFSVVSQVNCAGTINTATNTPVSGQPRGYYEIVSMSADDAQLVLRATYNGAQFDKTFSVSKSRQGAGGETAAIIRMLATSQQFYFDSFGVADPSDQVITFQLIRNPAAIETAVWSSSPTVALVGSGDTRTLSVAAAGTNRLIKVRVDVGSLYDEITVVRTEQGDNGVVGYLTNEAHVAPADASGNIADYSAMSGSFNVFDGAANVTSSATFSVVSAVNCTGTINTADNVPVSGQLRGYYRVTNLTTDYGELRLRATYNGEQIDKVFSITKSNRPMGSGGANLVTNGSATAGDNRNFRALRGGVPLAYQATGGVDGSACFSRTGINDTIFSDEVIPYRAGQVVEASIMVRSPDTADNLTYFGVDSLSADGQSIPHDGCYRFAGTSTTLQTAVTAGQSTLRIVPPSADWVPDTYLSVQFATLADDTDLPVPPSRMWRGNSTVATVDKSAAPAYWEVTLGSVAPFSYPAGTRVSLSRSGGSYSYCAINGENPQAIWTKYSGRVFGVNDKNTAPTANQFRYGTTMFRPVILHAYTAAASRTTYFDDIRLEEVSTSALAGYLTNEAHIVPATNDGTVTSYAGAEGQFRVYSGLTDITDNCTFTFSTANCTGTVNGVVNSPVNGQPRGFYRVTAVTADAAQMTISAAYAGATVTKIFVISKARAGTTGAASRSVALSASSQIFKFNGSGIADPAGQTITLTCLRDNISAAATWTTTPSVTLGGTGDTRTLAVADFGGNTSVRIRVEVDGLFDEVTVIRVQDGPQGSAGNDGAPGPGGPPGTPSFTLIGSSNVSIVINRVTKTGGSPQWDAGAYSLQSFPDGVYCTFRPLQTNGSFMAGLNSDPAADHSYLSLDFAWYCLPDGTLQMWESGAPVSSAGSYSTSTILSIVYDGHVVRYVKDGVTQRFVRRSNLALFFDSSIYSPLSGIADIGFGPSGARGAPGGNLLDNESWTEGQVTSSIGNFGSVSTVAGESTILLSGGVGVPYSGPYGTTELLWQARCLDPAAGNGGEANGGWSNSGDLLGLDSSKTYRSVHWVMRNNVASPNSIYHGCDTSYTDNLDGTQNTNPYFYSTGTNNLVADKWYLSVGIIHGNSYNGGLSGLSGLWDPATGTRALAGNDYKMRAGAVRQTHRAFMYYGGNTDVRLWLARPRFEEVNGNEPSITTLLSPQGLLAYRNSVSTDSIDANSATAVAFTEFTSWNALLLNQWFPVASVILDHRKGGLVYTQPSVLVSFSGGVRPPFPAVYQAALTMRLRAFDLSANQYITPDPQKTYPYGDGTYILVRERPQYTFLSDQIYVQFVVPGSSVNNRWVRYELEALAYAGSEVFVGVIGSNGVLSAMENKR